ncbi:MAG: flagellar filament capping protein FliD [Pseudomonadaceae bacterium]|nr:flagellar filament capping protein FliD [Pseudomonadaceae bacterium]
MAGITGIGSGVNIDAIVKATVDAERAPKQAQLDRLDKASTARLSGLGSLRSALEGLGSVLTSLNAPAAFNKQLVSSSAPTVFTATASGTLPVGRFNLQIEQLAAGSKVALQAATAGATFNSGVLTISAGTNSLDVTVEAGKDKLTDIRDAINTAGQAKGISASIISDASGSRLVLSSSNTGVGNDIKVSAVENGVSSGSAALTSLAFDPLVTTTPPNTLTGEAGIINKAQSAKFSVDGLPVVKPTNSIDDVISGVTISLVSAQSATDIAAGKTVDINITQDKGSVRANLQKFVDAYNKLIDTTSELTSVVKVGEDKQPLVGPLLGDSSIRNLQASLRKELTALGEAAGLRSLGELGITTQKDGKLGVDSAKLDTALANNFDKVAGYLTGSGGLMGRLAEAVKPFNSSGGLLDQRQKGLQLTLSDVKKQRGALDVRIAQVQERLYKQYNAMDQLVGQLRKTSEALSGQLASLPGSVKK